MTTFQPHLQSISSANMSFDEMNFASRLGDDDIDIDIDLETGPNDEDYILEDVNSDDGNGDTLVNADDVMIDDENISYPMDDVEALHHEHIEMEDAYLSDRPTVGLNNTGTDISLVEDTLHYASAPDQGHKAILDGSQSHATQLEDVEAKQFSIAQNLIEEHGSLQDEIVDANITHSLPTAPPQHIPDVPVGVGEHIPISYQPYSQSPDANTGEQDPVNAVAVPESVLVVELAQDVDEFKSVEGENATLGADRIVVTYQDMEYAMFSTTDTDDPDTFFLKDGNLINGSFGDLLAGLRSIIHEDLAPDDELCLVIEDLGIEISETCISVHKVIFASVIDLHQKLLRNDGLETATSLHLTLSIKPDFAKRLASLATGAAAGRGISDLISWDESSEILEEEEKPADLESGVSSETTDQNAEGGDESTENHGNPPISDGAGDEHLSEDEKSIRNVGEAGKKVETLSSSGSEHVSQLDARLAVSGNVSPKSDNQGQQVTPDRKSTSQLAAVSSHSEGGQDSDREENEDQGGDEDEDENEDGDGDLIDYEDEEYESVHDTYNPPVVDSNAKPYEENPPLETYSLPPTTGENGYEVQPNVDAGYSPSTHSGQDPGQNTSHETEDKRDPFSELQYPGERENEEDFKRDSEESHFLYNDEEKGSEEDGDANIVSEDTYTNFEESFNPSEPGHETNPVGTTGDEHEELDYGTTSQYLTDTYDGGDNTRSFLETQKSTTLAVGSGDDDADEISYEEENIPEPNESEHTLIAEQPGHDLNLEAAGVIQDDEINYESDPQEDLQIHPYLETAADTSPTSNGFSGKRQRGDADDTTDRTSKHSKRARS